MKFLLPRSSFLLPLLLLLAGSATAGPPLPPPPPQAPLLFVRLLGPPGMKTTYLPGTPAAQTYDRPVAVGLRPGYIYRAQLDGLPDLRGRSLYPSLEVRGSLGMHPADVVRFPVTVRLTAEDLERVQAGALLTKVAYLECPDQAPAVTGDPDAPTEYPAATEAEAVTEARLRGRVMLVFRLGERDLSGEDGRLELARQAVPGTVLLPGATTLPPPPVPPYLPTADPRPLGRPLFDPLLGPRCLTGECLRDGGDGGLPVGIGPDGKLHGLDPADTAMEFTDATGRRRVQPSNPVCVCVPRFAIMRAELLPGGLAISVPTVAHTGTKGPDRLTERLPPRLALVRVQPERVQAPQKPIGVVGQKGPQAIEQLTGAPQVVGRIAGTQVIGEVRELDEITAYPGCPLLLTKWYTPQATQIGDVVTFYLRYQNRTAQTIHDVAVSDSLTARLEYVAGSARSDRAATLTIRPNEAGSVVLRWEIATPLPPGQSGMLTFEAKVR